MNYVSQAQTPKPGALLASVAIPLGVGALLATSLAFTIPEQVIEDKWNDFVLAPDPIDPPPPPPEQETTDAVVDSPVTSTRLPDIIIPQPDLTLIPGPNVSTGDFTLPDIVIETPGVGAGSNPASSVSISATGVIPRGNPGTWITQSDYRTRWINEGLTGVARFRLSVSASGQVTDCTITQSTGHTVLDGATCRLLERRAKFKPARTGTGDKVAGTYTSSISWEIPN